jgi:HCOMODA/2-hydroxy-3-carboxy-muconic semialdehyde decarboxylase
MGDEARSQLVRAARIVAAAGLADAFGHVTVRAHDALLITAPVPLAFQSADDVTALHLDAADLPVGVPKEAWIHVAIASAASSAKSGAKSGADSDTVAIVRAQPRAVARAVAAGRRIRALDGQGALLGPEVPFYDDSRLVRDAAAGAAVARTLGDAPAVILRGNGAVTRGPDLASAVARMWLLERSAELSLAAPADAPALPDEEQAWWRERSAELLPRMYDFLVRTHGN